MLKLNERGAAIVLALFMMVMVTALGAAMVHVARTETLSSGNYTSMTQGRYAAESGLAAASNYLLSNSYAVTAPGTGADAITNYDVTVSPVRRNGVEVVLSSDPGVNSNYANAAVINAFQVATAGALQVDGAANYTARARLLAMRQITDGITGQLLTLQTWEITGVGRRASGEIAGFAEVSAVIERGTRPVFNYAAFATANGCDALTMTGNTATDSYDSGVPVAPGNTPVLSPTYGNLGTNGNLGAIGQAQVNGTLSTPMTGVGACTANNVTAATLTGQADIAEGLVQLPQPVSFPTPPVPSPLPPTNNQQMNNPACPAGYAATCTVNGSNIVFTPSGATPVLLGNVTINGGQTVVLKAGTYHVNSMTIAGGGRIVVDASSGGQVNIILAGQGGGQRVFDVTGNGIANGTWDPSLLRIQYHGTKELQFDGNGDTAAIIYAPNAQARMAGTADFYGSVIMRTVNSVGTAGLHYDRRLQRSTITAANPIMTSFTWHTF